MSYYKSVDAIVIGSGFGGSIAALRLGQAGYQVLVLERGKRWPITEARDTFATYDHPDGRAAWLSDTTVDPIRPGVPIDRYTGLLDRFDGDGISVLRASGVGGGSLAFQGMMVEPPKELFAQVLPQMDYEAFHTRYYPRVRIMTGAHPLPSHLLPSPHFENVRTFASWAEGAGFSVEHYDMAMDWAVVEQEIEGQIEPHVLAGERWYGINSGARLSLDRNYLQEAEATGNVTILPLHLVTDIQEHTDQLEERFVISGAHLETNGETKQRFLFSCRFLFLAAGSIGTTELLMHAQARGTLHHMNAFVGQGWGNNGDSIGFHTGHPTTGASPQVPAGVGFLDLSSPSGPLRVLGDAIDEPGTLLTLAIATSPMYFPNRGCFHFNCSADRLTLHWPTNEDPALSALTHTAEQIYARLNHGRPQLQSHVQSSLTAHPLGGVCLGTACHYDGRVCGYQNLYVVDGSLLPGSSGSANPSLTIAALAEYLLEIFLENRAGTVLHPQGTQKERC